MLLSSDQFKSWSVVSRQMPMNMSPFWCCVNKDRLWRRHDSLNYLPLVQLKPGMIPATVSMTRGSILRLMTSPCVWHQWCLIDLVMMMLGGRRKGCLWLSCCWSYKSWSSRSDDIIKFDEEIRLTRAAFVCMAWDLGGRLGNRRWLMILRWRCRCERRVFVFFHGDSFSNKVTWGCVMIFLCFMASSCMCLECMRLCEYSNETKNSLSMFLTSEAKASLFISIINQPITETGRRRWCEASQGERRSGRW